MEGCGQQYLHPRKKSGSNPGDPFINPVLQLDQGPPLLLSGLQESLGKQKQGFLTHPL